MSALVGRTVSIVFLCLLMSRLAVAQGVGAIGGTATDASGAVLPGVTVSLSNPGTIGGNQETISDERGAYQFTRLIPGRYSVKAQLTGFRPVVQENIVVDADVTARADLKLELGDVQETVIVSGQQALLDTTSALNQTVMARQVLDTLPGTNDVWGIARIVPSIILNQYDVGGSLSFQQTKISVHGSGPDGESNYKVNGMNIDAVVGATGNVTMYYDPFMFEEINYQTSNGSADTARGGVVYNMVTKTGTNVLRGSYMFDGSNQNFQSDNITGDLRSQLLLQVPARALAANPGIEPAQKILHIYDTGGVLGGPIVPDKLWFMGSAKVVGLNQLRLGSYNPDGSQFVDDNLMRTVSVNISWAVNPQNQIHVLNLINDKQRFHYDGNTTTGFVDSAATWNQTLKTGLNQVRWTSTRSSRLLLDASASLARTLQNLPPQSSVGAGTIPGYDVITATTFAAMGVYTQAHYTRGVAQASLTYVAGGHSLQAGYQYDLGKARTYNYSLSNDPAGLVAVYANGVPDYVNTYNTPTYYTQYIEEQGVFIQDKWTPTRKISLNLGFRIDRTTGWMPADCQPQTIFIQGQCFPAISGTPSWLDVAPRTALVYDVFGNGKTAVKVGFNRYNIGIGTGTLDLVNPIRTTDDTRSWTCPAPCDGIPTLNELGPSTGFNLGTTNHYASGFKRPRTLEYSAEIQQQLRGDVVLSVAYFRRDTRDNIGEENLAVPMESYAPLQVTEKNSGRQVTVYNQSPALLGHFNVLWNNFPALNSNYNGMDLNVNKRLTGQWMVIGGLSLNRNVGDIYGTAGAISYGADLNNPNFMFRQGVIGSDIPVAIKVSSSYQWRYGIVTSAVLQHYTGLPETTSVSVGRSTVALTQVTQSLVVEPRATERLPNVNLLDLNAKKTFKIMGKLTAQGVFEVFNVLNSSAIQSENTVLGPGYGNAAAVVPGRMAKFGFNVNF